MNDIAFNSAVIGVQKSYETSNYSAQDLETQIPGPAVPFTYDFQFGFVWLSLDFITPTPPSFLVEFAPEDLENMVVGPVTKIPATFIQTPNPVASTTLIPSVYFNTGVITPQTTNYADDDLESYPVGAITRLTNAFEGGGDVSLQIGYVRPTP